MTTTRFDVRLGTLALALLMSTLALPAAAQIPTPGTFLVYSRFQVDADFDSLVRVVNVQAQVEEGVPNPPVDVAVTFVCADSCESLTTTVTLDPGETRALDVANLNLPCEQGFAAAYAVDDNGAAIPFDFLTGSYEVSRGGKGKRREADVAVAIPSEAIASINDPVLLVLGTPIRGERLMSDFRSISIPDRRGVRRQGSYLNLLDLSIEAGGANSETSATVEWWTEDGETNFSTTYRFTCFGRVRLDEINANLLEENHGSAVGWMRIRARGNSILVGSISEFGKGSSSGRNMFDATASGVAMRRGRP